MHTINNSFLLAFYRISLKRFLKKNNILFNKKESTEELESKFVKI